MTEEERTSNSSKAPTNEKSPSGTGSDDFVDPGGDEYQERQVKSSQCQAVSCGPPHGGDQLGESLGIAVHRPAAAPRWRAVLERYLMHGKMTKDLILPALSWFDPSKPRPAAALPGRGPPLRRR